MVHIIVLPPPPSHHAGCTALYPPANVLTQNSQPYLDSFTFVSRCPHEHYGFVWFGYQHCRLFCTVTMEEIFLRLLLFHAVPHRYICSWVWLALAHSLSHFLSPHSLLTYHMPSLGTCPHTLHLSACIVTTIAGAGHFGILRLSLFLSACCYCIYHIVHYHHLCVCTFVTFTWLPPLYAIHFTHAWDKTFVHAHLLFWLSFFCAPHIYHCKLPASTTHVHFCCHYRPHCPYTS